MSTPGLSRYGFVIESGTQDDDKVKIDLLMEIDQHLFVEEGIRGGVAMISQRYN